MNTSKVNVFHMRAGHPNQHTNCKSIYFNQNAIKLDFLKSNIYLDMSLSYVLASYILRTPGGVLYAVVKLIHYADRDRVQLLPPAV